MQINTEQHDKITKLLAQGQPIEKIAKELGLSRQRVYKIIEWLIDNGKLRKQPKFKAVK